MGGAKYAYVLDCGDGITDVCNVQINLTVLIKYEKKLSQRGFFLGLKERRINYLSVMGKCSHDALTLQACTSQIH